MVLLPLASNCSASPKAIIALSRDHLAQLKVGAHFIISRERVSESGTPQKRYSRSEE